MGFGFSSSVSVSKDSAKNWRKYQYQSNPHPITELYNKNNQEFDVVAISHHFIDLCPSFPIVFMFFFTSEY